MKPFTPHLLTPRWAVILVVLLAFALAACGSAATPTPTTTPTQAVALPTAAATDTPPLPPPTNTPPPAPTATASPSPLPTSTPTIPPTAAPAPTSTFTATAVPTYTKLRGEVIIEQAVCHYGPGKPYLYKYGVYQGSNLEIIARDPLADYMEVQAIGGNNPCWVKGEYLKIKGDMKSLKPIDPRDWKLPPSPYYGPMTGVSASRSGDVVTVGWNPVILKAGDSSEQVPYVVEAWVCKDGQVVFTPVGSWQTAVKITDEPGCSEPSHARVTAAEKHGYTRFVEVPWP